MSKTEHILSGPIGRVAVVVLFLAAWEGTARLGWISPFFFSSPSEVFDVIRVWYARGHIFGNMGFTLAEAFIGLVIGAVLGTAIGFALAFLPRVAAVVEPFMAIMNSFPRLTLAPLFIVWFGFGITSKVLIAAILAFFPILTNTVLGVKSIDRGHRDVMVSLNATRWQIFRRLELPSALPYIITGMEVGIVLAIIGAIVGEYLGGNDGLGHLLVSRMNAFETDGLFAVMIHMTILGFLFYFGISALRRVLTPWHETAQRDRS